MSAVGLSLLAIATLLGVSGLTVAERHTVEWVDHSRDVILSAQRFLAALTDAETGQRGFELTGDERYLEPYHRALATLDRRLAALHTLTAGNPNHQRRLEQLYAVTREKLNDLAETVQNRRNHGIDAVPPLMPSDRGRMAMVAARSLVGEIEGEESTLLETRIRQRQTTLALFSIFAFVGAVLGMVLIFFGMRSRMRNQKVMRESENQFRTLANGIPQLCWMANGDGWIFWYNQRWYDYTGSTAEQMTGWGWQSVLAAETLPDVLKGWKDSLATGKPFEMVYPIRGIDGGFRPFLTRILPVRNESGKIVRWFGTHTEIGEQRRVEQALRESEERLRLAQQSAHVGTFEWNIQTGMHQWTPELEAMYGLPPGGFAGTLPALKNLVQPEDWVAALKKIHLAMETGNFEADWRVLWPDKSLHWLSARGRVFNDEAGKPLRMIGVNIDVTERRLAEQALRESQLRYSTLAEALPAIVFTHTFDGRTDYVNRRWEEYTGWTLEESADRSVHSLIHPDDRHVVEERWTEARNNGTSYEAEFRLRRADGVYRWFRCRATPLRNDQGRIVRWLGISSDTDEEKKSEERLRQSQKMEAVGRLAGGVAHDFNNLLTAISGYAGLLAEKVEDEPLLAGYTQQVQAAVERATALTRQLLTFSRRQIAEPKVLKLNEMVLNMRKLLGRVIGEDIEISTILAPDLWYVRADPMQLDQVIMNLAVNARDAMPGGGRLAFETANRTVSQSEAAETQVAPGEYVTLQIRDTGCGMDAEVKSRVFEPFFTTKGKDQGTGLGLSIVYGAVQQNGGFIGVESAPGAGTTFTLYFRRCRDADEDGTIAASSDPQGAAETGETVLLVEDEPAVRNLAKALLQARGYRIMEAGTPAEAIAMVSQYRDPIHLLLTDVLMPGMRGPELAALVREIRPELPVLYMSGYSDSTFLDSRVLNGARFLQKPFSAAALAGAVRSTLEGSTQKQN